MQTTEHESKIVNSRWSGYAHLLGARMKELRREPEVIFWVFVFPLLLAFGLGIAFRNKPADVASVVITDGPHAQELKRMLETGAAPTSAPSPSSSTHAGTSPAITTPSTQAGTSPAITTPSTHAGTSSENVAPHVSAGNASPDASGVAPRATTDAPKSTIRADILPESAALDRFRLGSYALVITPRDSSVEYRYDPARPESVQARIEVDNALQRAAGRKDAILSTAVQSSEPGARYIDFLIPGLLGMNLMNSGMWGIGFALVEMRQRKLLKRFVATPMRRTDFLMALTSSRLVLMIIELGLLLGFGILVFHMRVMGSLLAILLISALGAISFGGLGLLTASRAQKIESVSGLINLVMMPMWIFSGVFFSYERFPAIVIPFIKALPLTALNDSLRAVILQGAPLASQGLQIAVLAIWGGVSFLLALRWFRWS